MVEDEDRKEEERESNSAVEEIASAVEALPDSTPDGRSDSGLMSRLHELLRWVAANTTKVIGLLAVLAGMAFSITYVMIVWTDRTNPNIEVESISPTEIMPGQEFDVTGKHLDLAEEVQLRKKLVVERLFMMPLGETGMLVAVPSSVQPAEYILEMRKKGKKEFVSTARTVPVVTPTPTPLPTPTPTSTPTPTPTPTPPPTPTPTPTPTPIPKIKSTIIFANMNWDTARMQNAIARFIVENGYGCPTDSIPDLPGQAGDVFKSLVNGNINVYLEVWLPNLREEWEEALETGSVIPLGKSLDVTWQSGFVVPTYMVDGNPDTGNPNAQAPGLVTVQDLRNHTQVFAKAGSEGKAVLWNCLPIWGCAVINEGQVRSYGLSDVIELRNPGSEGELFNKVLLATEDGLAWLGYMWSPTKAASTLDLIRLEQPKCDVGQNPEDGCGYDDSLVRIAVRPSLVAEASDLVELFRKWDFKESTLFVAEGCLEETNGDFKKAAVCYLKKDQAVWTQWLTTAATQRVREELKAS